MPNEIKFQVAYDSDLEFVAETMREVAEKEVGEAIVRYLVHPKEAGRVKTRLIKDLLKALHAAPDRVLFPRGDAR